MFNCDRCGICCRSLDKSELYKFLDRGDGVCRYLNGNLCSIYNQRPLICNVDACYNLYYKNTMTLEEFYNLNYQACKKLKEKETNYEKSR